MMCTFPRTKDNSKEEERPFTPAADYMYLPDSSNVPFPGPGILLSREAVFISGS